MKQMRVKSRQAGADWRIFLFLIVVELSPFFLLV